MGDVASKIAGVRSDQLARDCHSRYPIRRIFRRTVVRMDGRETGRPIDRRELGRRIDRRELGRRGEELAADHLVRRGFSILERNFRTRWGELDIVAFDGHTLVFCEVKSRRCPGVSRRAGQPAVVPFESLHPRKRHQVRRMANVWMSSRPERPYAPLIRFDAIGVTFGVDGGLVRLDHLEGGF